MRVSLKWMLSFTALGLVLSLSLLLPVAAQDATPGGPMPTPDVLTATPIPRPLPINSLTQERTTVEFYFDTLPQGETRLIRVSGEGMAGARFRLFDELIEMFAVEGDGFYGYLSPSMEQITRAYDLDIFVWYADDTRQTINTQVDVGIGNFIRQDITLPPDKAYLIDPEIERNELARLESIFSQFTLERLWDGRGFHLPIPGGELTSPFGAFRNFNQVMQTRHTGWDIRATLGQPLLASAAGQVAYTGFMDIRGNIVIIDHGYGVYSTYCHLSQTHVTRGQSIAEGQVIGTVGNTGRTSGPHFHWEMAVNGHFVDARQFLEMWKPG